MANIKIFANKYMVESSISVDDLKKVQAYRPDALKCFDEDGNETFKVAATTGCGSINAYGVGFNTQTNGDVTFAAMTADIPEGVKDPVDYVAEKVRLAFPKLSQIEQGIEGVITDVDAETEAVKASIEVIA
ncbi:MAG: hypothetical protein RR365_01130 [Bacteroides sp.]